MKMLEMLEMLECFTILEISDVQETAVTFSDSSFISWLKIILEEKHNKVFTQLFINFTCTPSWFNYWKFLHVLGSLLMVELYSL